VRIPQAAAHRLAGERLERGRADEMLGPCGHHHTHLGALLAQAADQFATLVGGDAAGHSQQDAALGEAHVRRA